MGECYAVEHRLAELRRAERWERVALAMLAEAVAALVIELPPIPETEAGGCRRR